MKIIKTKLLASTLTLGLTSGALAFGLSGGPAQASIVVNNWNVKSTVGWCSWVGGSVTPSMPGTLTPPAPSDCPQATIGGVLAQRLQWGTPVFPPGTDPSALVIGNDNVNVPVTTTMDDPPTTFYGPVYTVTHENFRITNGADAPSMLRLLANTMVDPVSPDLGGFMDLGTLPVDLLFGETDNGQPPPVDGGPCTILPGTTEPCPDYVVVDRLGGLPGFTPINLGDLTFQSRTFDVGSYQYGLFVQLTGLTQLTPDQCKIATANSTYPGQAGRENCVGLLTSEEMNNVLSVNVAIRKIQEIPRVPEPSSLGMLAAGLAGLGLLGKRKQTK